MRVRFDARGGGFLFHDAGVGVDACSVRGARGPLYIHLFTSKKSTVAAICTVRIATVSSKAT
ncbi:hypothetical protein DB771_26220 [Burkholderia sp. AU29985]|nr:hypothetical protein EGY28_09605 [Burkholderia dolosa]PRE53406.1 hypothetical protein C6P87_07540 [Burkholderia sp. AU12872]PUA73805.1 hypothetical protein DB771_26220 [Burkholderia sp. AU29985]